MFHYNLFYKDGYVDTDEQGVVKWNDVRFGMEWPTKEPILSKRDGYGN
jgi:dTDP-4-dehydrorhamnose 3,5-epimerase